VGKEVQVSSRFEDPERRVVPRWRPSWVTASLGELGYPGTAGSGRAGLDQKGLLQNLAAWERHRSATFGADLVGAALVLERHDIAREAAEYLLASGSEASPVAARLARFIVEPGHGKAGDPPALTVDARRQRISSLRRRLQSGPRNALGWIDLAREYAVLGQVNPSEHAVRIALSLAPDNRFVVRSAARFFMHKQDPEQAHHILRHAVKARSDPWLLAAEIAAASVAGRVPGSIKSGRRLIDSGHFTAWHVSELACAIGTAELGAAKRSDIRRLFRRALTQPTENALAQVSWAVRRDNQLLEIDPSAYETPRSYEARAWERFVAGAWGEAVGAAEEWQLDEPFATRPAAFGSFLAAVALGDLELGALFARRGLEANPDDALLLNNLSFTLATADRVDEARAVFARIRKAGLDPAMRAAYLATSGLLSYRDGRVEEGHDLYMTSITSAKEANAPATSAWATLFHAREQLRVGSDYRSIVLAKANAALDDLPNDMRSLGKKVLTDVAALPELPESHGALRGQGNVIPVKQPSMGRRIARSLLRLFRRQWP